MNGVLYLIMALKSSKFLMRFMACAIQNFVRIRQSNCRHQKAQVQQQLPHHSFFWCIACVHKGLQHMDR